MYSVSHHHLLAMLTSLYMVFRLIVILSYLHLMGRLLRQIQSFASLTVLEYWTPLMWRHLTLKFASRLDLIKSQSLSSYHLIIYGEVGEVCACYIFMIIQRRSYSRDRCMSFKLYFL